MPIPECNQLERWLDAAARRFVHERSAADRRRRTGLELRFLFARLGVSFADLDELSGASGGSDLCPLLRARLFQRLDAERRRLRRLARAGSAVYDAGRHLAIRSAIRWLEDEASAGLEAEAASRLPGSVLNNRFRGRRPSRKGGSGTGFAAVPG